MGKNSCYDQGSIKVRRILGNKQKPKQQHSE